MNENHVPEPALSDLAAPLLEALRAGGALRLVARPHQVTLDWPHGSTTAHVTWDQDQHRTLWSRLPSPQTMAANVAGVRVGEAIVVEAWAASIATISQLAEQGGLSPLCGQLLEAASAMGRNILFTGPIEACLPVMAGLIDGAARPVMLASDSWSAQPAGWLWAHDLSEAQRLGADRFGAWGISARAMGRVMTSLTGVVGHLEAGRLDRVLMRFEGGWNRPNQGPLAVLCGVDLIVVMRRGQPSAVVEVAEIVMTDAAYKPRKLFVRGAHGVPQALSPVASPSFSTELSTEGFAALSEALSAAVEAEVEPQSPSMAENVEPETTSPMGSRAAVPSLFSQARQHLERSAKAQAATRRPAVHRSAPAISAPGWELDRLSLPDASEDIEDSRASTADDEPTAVSSPRPLSEEEATLAANFGLAPPPAPSSRPAVQVEPPAATGFQDDTPETLRRR